MEKQPSNSAFDEDLSPTDTEVQSFSEEEKETLKSLVQRVINEWFDSKNFEQNPELYEKLGIRTFKKYVPTAGDLVMNLVYKGIFKKKDIYRFIKPKDLASLQSFEESTKEAEKYHVFSFAVMNICFAAFLLNGNFPEAISTQAMNIMINLYPIMLQRYNRQRAHRIIEKMRNRQKKPDESNLQ